MANNISIGEHKIINWIHFDTKLIEPKNIDFLIEPMEKFWKQLELECVAECCGIGAFSFWPENIRKASQNVNIPGLRLLIDTLIEEIIIIEDEVVISSLFNQLINKQMFLELLNHVKSHIKQIKST